VWATNAGCKEGGAVADNINCQGQNNGIKDSSDWRERQPADGGGWMTVKNRAYLGTYKPNNSPQHYFFLLPATIPFPALFPTSLHPIPAVFFVDCFSDDAATNQNCNHCRSPRCPHPPRPRPQLSPQPIAGLLSIPTVIFVASSMSSIAAPMEHQRHCPLPPMSLLSIATVKCLVWHGHMFLVLFLFVFFAAVGAAMAMGGRARGMIQPLLTQSKMADWMADCCLKSGFCEHMEVHAKKF
jgi:hypothetical protein